MCDDPPEQRGHQIRVIPGDIGQYPHKKVKSLVVDDPVTILRELVYQRLPGFGRLRSLNADGAALNPLAQSTGKIDAHTRPEVVTWRRPGIQFDKIERLTDRVSDPVDTGQAVKTRHPAHFLQQLFDLR